MNVGNEQLMHNTPVRYPELDALRGLAALSVVFHHCFWWFSFFKHYYWAVGIFPISKFMYGHFAVLFFFVLSGFVLSQPLIGGRRLDYLVYVVRRICRIYLPFAVVLLLVAFVASFFVLPSPLSPEPDYWSENVTIGLTAAHLFMTGIGPDSITLNPPMWSLIQELRISLIFPIIYMLSARLGWLTYLVNLVISVLAYKIGIRYGIINSLFYGETLFGSFLLTVYYTQFFTLGCVLAVKMPAAVAFFQRLPKLVHYLVTALIIFTPLRFLESHFHLGELINSFTAVYVITACLSLNWMRSFMLKKPLQWLGHVSYPLYLVHMPIIIVLSLVLSGVIDDKLICLLTLLVVLVAAHVFHIYLELPTIRLGQAAGRLRRQPDV